MHYRFFKFFYNVLKSDLKNNIQINKNSRVGIENFKILKTYKFWFIFLYSILKEWKLLGKVINTKVKNKQSNVVAIKKMD